jgi:hypothetical protein
VSLPIGNSIPNYTQMVTTTRQWNEKKKGFKQNRPNNYNNRKVEKGRRNNFSRHPNQIYRIEWP